MSRSRPFAVLGRIHPIATAAQNRPNRCYWLAVQGLERSLGSLRQATSTSRNRQGTNTHLSLIPHVLLPFYSLLSSHKGDQTTKQNHLQEPQPAFQWDISLRRRNASRLGRQDIEVSNIDIQLNIPCLSNSNLYQS